MRNESELSRAEKFVRLPREQRAVILSRYSKEQLEKLRFNWQWWGRPKQIPPTDREWSNWLILAGRGFGKTRTGAEWVRQNICGSTPLAPGRWKHVAIVAETAADARDVMVGDGKETSNPKAGSGILQVHPKDYLPKYTPSNRRLVWPNGAVATIYNATEPDQLRGPQHDAAWLDELAKWRYQRETYDQLEFGMRTGDNPQKLISTTPRPTLLIKQIIADKATIVTRGSTYDNVANLSGKFLDRIKAKYENTRLGRQEIDAEVLEDLDGALWTRANIEQYRVKLQDIPPLVRIVVAIDPAVSSEDSSNETGIVACGIDERGHAYVLDDESGIYSPDQWARVAISLYRERRADRVVAEVNQGGDLVENTLRSIDRSVSYASVWASKGKFLRAEPISALYEQGKIHHVGMFAQLEDQMTSFTVDFDRKGMGYSPDRMDALVWCLTELMVEGDERKPVWGSV